MIIIVLNNMKWFIGDQPYLIHAITFRFEKTEVFLMSSYTAGIIKRNRVEEQKEVLEEKGFV